MNIWGIISFFMVENVYINVTLQDGDYVLEKQVNGQGVSPYDPSHNSTAVLVGNL